MNPTHQLNYEFADSLNRVSLAHTFSVFARLVSVVADIAPFISRTLGCLMVMKRQ
jgi:hypothetical protein